ncbi:MAG: hypothetical protein KTR31_34795 [Myxococcales bacterium]|nr:hypothetical protein [Myxococcales bacterium]
MHKTITLASAVTFLGLIGAAVALAQDPDPPDQGPPEPDYLPAPDALGECFWVAEDNTSNAGGLRTECPPSAFPVISGMYKVDIDESLFDEVMILSVGFGEFADGTSHDQFFDGYALHDDHQHGEPFPNSTATNILGHEIVQSGGISHHVLRGGSHAYEMRTLCCHSKPQMLGVDTLDECVYLTDLVETQPVSHPMFGTQHVATLECTTGKIAGGGCQPRFDHDDAPFSLTGSHPYRGTVNKFLPTGPHGALGPSGWACRTSDQPHVPKSWNEVPPYHAIAVTALCCE